MKRINLILFMLFAGITAKCQIEDYPAWKLVLKMKEQYNLKNYTGVIEAASFSPGKKYSKGQIKKWQTYFYNSYPSYLNIINDLEKKIKGMEDFEMKTKFSELLLKKYEYISKLNEGFIKSGDNSLLTPPIAKDLPALDIESITKINDKINELENLVEKEKSNCARVNLNKANEYFEGLNYERALFFVNESFECNSADEDLNSQVNSLKQKINNKIAESLLVVSSKMSQKTTLDKIAIRTLLDSALILDPNNSKIKDQLDEYEGIKLVITLNDIEWATKLRTKTDLQFSKLSQMVTTRLTSSNNSN